MENASHHFEAFQHESKKSFSHGKFGLFRDISFSFKILKYLQCCTFLKVNLIFSQIDFAANPLVSQVEGDLQRAEERAEAGENKIVELEEELRVVGENLKALEVAEEKAQQREEEYKKQIKNLTDRSINMSLIVNTALKNCRIL